MINFNMKLSALALLLVLGSGHIIVPLALVALFGIGVSGVLRDQSQF